MYLDKLYTKLYSDGNIEGLKLLMSEIRAFSNDLSKDARMNAKKGLAEMFKDPSARFKYVPKKDRIKNTFGK